MNSVDLTTDLQTLLTGENVQMNLSVPHLVEKILERKEGVLTSSGAVRATTGTYTGRSPKDKFIVEEASTKDKIDWGAVNQPISEAAFDRLYAKVLGYLKERDELYVFEGFAGADEKYRLPITVVNEFAWHNLFARQLFIRPEEHDKNLKNSRLRFFQLRISKPIRSLTEPDLKRLSSCRLRSGRS